MKKRIINLFIALMFTSATVFASNISGITKDGANTFILNTNEWKSDYLDVEIRNDQGNLIFDDRYTTDKNKKFNFEKLPAGMYTITLSDDFKSTKQTFEIFSNELILHEDVKTIYKPIITYQENFIDLNYLTNGKDVDISVYEGNNIIFNVNIKNELAVHKRFDIGQLPKGNYTFIVSSNNQWSSKPFER